MPRDFRFDADCHFNVWTGKVASRGRPNGERFLASCFIPGFSSGFRGSLSFVGSWGKFSWWGFFIIVSVGN